MDGCYDGAEHTYQKGRINIQTLHKKAYENNGECLSNSYVKATDHYKWKCHDPNHPIFEMTWAAAQKDRWCRLCGREKSAAKKRTSIIALQRLAKEKWDGSLLSTTYKINNEKLEWRCSNQDHPSFWMSWDSVSRGRWCQECSKDKQRIPTSSMEEKAKERNGKLLSRYCKDEVTYGVWSCENQEHPPFHARWNVVRKGIWCKKCSGNCPEEAKKRLESIVAEKGGKVIDTYINAHTLIRVKCQKGHVWEVSPNAITNVGNWCPTCKNSRGEVAVGKYLTECNIPFTRQFKHPSLPDLRYDFFFEYDNRKYLLEFDGEQHFKEDPTFFHRGEGKFDHQQNLDRLKTYIAIATGYCIIRIDYTQINTIKDHITQAIEFDDMFYLSNEELYEYLNRKIPDEIYKKYVSPI